MMKKISKILLLALFAISVLASVDVSPVIAEGCSTRYVTVCVTDGARFIHDLDMEHFNFEENRTSLVPPYIELLNDCPSESLMVDVVLFVDLSTSMDEKIVELRENIPEFVAGISMMDYRIGMVIFNGCREELIYPRVGVLEEVRVDLSDDVACSTYSDTAPDMWASNIDEYTCLFTAGWNEFYTRPTSGRGHGDEDQYGAMAQYADDISFRDGARRVFILFTDERPVYSEDCAPSWDHTIDDLYSFIGYMEPYNLDIFTVTPENGSFYGSGDERFYTGYVTLAEETGASWFDLEAPDFSELVDDITARIGLDSCCYNFMFTDTFFCRGTNFLEIEVPGWGMGETYFQSQCPPEAVWITPDWCGGYTSCEYQEFEMMFQSDMDFGIAGLEVAVEGVVYDLSAPELLLTDDDILRFTPAIPWENGSAVTLDLLWAVDDSGCFFDAPPCSFRIDIEPPVYPYFTPFDGELIIESEPRIYFVVVDSLTGVNWEAFDTSDVVVSVNGVRRDDLRIIAEGDTVEIRGLSFVDGDSVSISASFRDSPDYDYCTPNSSEIQWSFIVVINRPTAWLISPWPGTISACVDQNIRMGIVDSNGIDWSTVVVNIAGTRFTMENPWLFHSGDTLIFAPDSGFYEDNSVIEVELIAAEDIYGMPLATPLNWIFYTDFSPPIIAQENPSPLEMLFYRQPTMEFALYDSMSGVDPNSIRLTILDHIFELGDFFWDPTEDELGGTLSLTLDENIVSIFPGDTMVVTLFACDQPDSCGPSCTEQNFHIPVEPVSFCERRPNPFSPNGDGYNDFIQFNYPFMFSEEATLQIYDKRKQLMRSIEIDVSRNWQETPIFDGLDKNGKSLSSGLYLYIIIREGEVVCEGTITLVR